MDENIKTKEKKKCQLSVVNTLKTILIVGCAGYFSYEAYQVIDMFIAYETVITLDYKQPNVTDLPAVTICAYSFVSDQVLANHFGYPRNYLDNDTDQDLIHQVDEQKKSDSYVQREITRNKALRHSPAHYWITDPSMIADKFIKSCKFFPKYKTDREDSIDCKSIVPVVDSIYKNRRCYTYLSQLNVTKVSYNTSHVMDYEMNSFIRITFTKNIIRYGHHLNNETFLFAVHSPDIIASYLDADYYPLPYSKPINYDIRFTKQISKLQKPPYETMCRDYIMTDKSGENSRGDCLNQCIKYQTTKDCINYYSIITLDITNANDLLCNYSQSSYEDYKDALHECRKQCQRNCLEQVIKIEYVGDYFNNETTLDIRLDTSTFTYIYHDQSMRVPEFIGILGGHAHIWLGFSLLKFFNTIVHGINKLKHSL